MKRTLQLTSPLMHGTDVVYARNLLRNHGTVWDEQACNAARRKKWALGYAADKCTGTFGTQLELYLTERAYPTTIMQLRAKARARKDVGARAVAEARKWVGTEETPPNSNIAKPFTPWYGWIGWGAPWCAVFVTYCLVKAGFKHASPKNARWAYCPYVLADAKAGRYGLSLCSEHDVKEGTILLFDWDRDGKPDHIGFATGPINFARGTVDTVEGNTSPDEHGDQSNGGQVCLKTRRLRDIIAFVHAAD